MLAGLIAFLAFSAVSHAQTGADPARGKLLYDARCSACHESSVHDRKARKAGSLSALRAQVQRWSVEVGGAWSADEIDDVTQYLNLRYYHFPCPQSVCKADQASLAR